MEVYPLKVFTFSRMILSRSSILTASSAKKTFLPHATSSRERERYSIDESEKIWFVFQSDTDEEEFYGFD